MGVTANRAYSIPELGESANIPADLLELAAAIDADMQAALEFRGARAYRDAPLSLLDGLVTSVGLAGEDFDSHGLHPAGGNDSLFTLNKVGWWLIVGQVYFAANGIGLREAIIRRFAAGGGTAIVEGFTSAVPSGTNSLGVQVAALVRATAITDLVGLAAYQTSGGSLDVQAGRGSTWMSVHYLGV